MEIQNIPEVNALINHIVNPLDIESILCYGSYAGGLQDTKSDIDLLVLVNKLPTISELQKLYNTIPGVKNFKLKDLDHWDNSWTKLNATFEINETKIDIGFNTISWVETVIK